MPGARALRQGKPPPRNQRGAPAPRPEAACSNPAQPKTRKNQKRLPLERRGGKRLGKDVQSHGPQCRHPAADSLTHPPGSQRPCPGVPRGPCPRPTPATCSLTLLPTGLSCGWGVGILRHIHQGPPPWAVNTRLCLPCLLLPHVHGTQERFLDQAMSGLSAWPVRDTQ